ncbi:acetate--CoA ligase [Frankia sp. AiPa1]|uniref:acetate--CoA ligase n=1 Tax=Frankia sp. AiPa1 TaxID=573492 RepID=UPI00202AFD38|nr:acetate--CoA ligase [Frankia sp. AiPa1]MCL9761116.1 acetate--CoA ligase [Frankia sp. AiPa1]
MLAVERFDPPAGFTRRRPVEADRAAADLDAERFWADAARDLLTWDKPFTQVLDDTNPPFYTWFADGELNLSANCLDRHVSAGRGERVAFHWRGEEGERRDVTYAQLLADTQRLANGLRSLGVAAGDVVGIFLPMIPEVAVAMLACARIGAVHNVVFGGFAPSAVRERMEVSAAKVLITVDGARRKGRRAEVKAAVDAELGDLPALEHIVVVRGPRTGGDGGASEPAASGSGKEPAASGTGLAAGVGTGASEAPMTPGRDVWYDALLAGADPDCPAIPLPAEHPLFILYSSGSTAKPKGILHTTAGYLLGATYTHRMVFDINPDTDVYWCSADVGWITGHSYIVYGPLSNGATSVMYEGAPDYPDRDIWWQIIEEFQVTVFYTAPTAIRTCIKWGPEYPGRHDLSSLRVLGTVGEPINPKAWLWYHLVIGGGRCPIVDTWWQTETGSVLISPLAGVTSTKPGSATQPLPGISPALRSEDGEPVTEGTGVLVITKPWPSMLRTLYKDDKRFVETYFSRFGPTTYVVGDAARLDADGYYWIIGRIDDVINVSGHRLSTAEVESAIVAHEAVAEAAVVAEPDEQTGQAIVAFVTLAGEQTGDAAMEARLREHVAHRIGKLARPRRIIWADDLPKTRSGKIMRRLLRDVAAGRELGDVTTLRDPAVMAVITDRVRTARDDEE